MPAEGVGQEQKQNKNATNTGLLNHIGIHSNSQSLIRPSNSHLRMSGVNRAWACRGVGDGKGGVY